MARWQVQFARALRHEATDAEKLLWQYLRAEQMGFKFRRQQPIGIYIVDFVCFGSVDVWFASRVCADFGLRQGTKRAT
ncbi:DUF559 domain-containing protein [Deefgea piscis]|nr:DUF559 domain-containing protein [Deefgea piscis]